MQRNDSSDRPTRPAFRAADGLPAGPRSRSVGRPRREGAARIDIYEPASRTVDSLSSRQVRPQQSMAAMPSRDRDRSQPPPSAQSRQRLQRIDTNTRSGANRRELDSLTSASSGGSSFMDRMKSGGSSRTSWEEDRKPVPEATSKSQGMYPASK